MVPVAMFVMVGLVVIMRGPLGQAIADRIRGASAEANPWIYGFSAVLRKSGAEIGTGGFAGPPEDGMVEIAYAVDEALRGKGYATEIAQALTEYAFASDEVRLVRAHTLPGGAASKRVLVKCGFRHVGDFHHPEDGMVWRFEKTR